MSYIDGCPVCGAHSDTEIWRLDEIPVRQLVTTGERIGSHLFSPFRLVRCQKCDHLYNDAHEPASWEKTYTDGFLTNRPVHPSMHKRLESLFEWIGPDLINGRAVLEIGAGTGHLSRILAGHANRVLVFEPDPGLTPEMLPEPNVHLRSTPFEAAAIDEPVDFILCRQVLEHLANPKAMLIDIASSLKPGGFAYLEVPDAQFIIESAAYFDLHAAHVQYFLRKNLIALCRECGLNYVRRQELMGGHDFGLLVSKKSGPDDLAGDVTPRRDTQSLAQRLGVRKDALVAALKTHPGPIHLYGATWQAVGMLGALGESVPNIQSAFDDNVQYHGAQLYHCRGRIPVGPYLPPDTDSLVLITAYLHTRTIRKRMLDSGYAGAILGLDDLG